MLSHFYRFLFRFWHFLIVNHFFLFTLCIVLHSFTLFCIQLFSLWCICLLCLMLLHAYIIFHAFTQHNMTCCTTYKFVGRLLPLQPFRLQTTLILISYSKSSNGKNKPVQFQCHLERDIEGRLKTGWDNGVLYVTKDLLFCR